MDYPGGDGHPHRLEYHQGQADGGGGPHRAPSAYAAIGRPSASSSNAWKWLLGIGIGLVVLCLGGLAACAAVGFGTAAKFGLDVEKAMDELAAKKGDVQVTSCESKPGELLSGVDVGYAITNSGEEPRSYVITFAVNDVDGNRLGYTMDSHDDVARGQKATGTARVPLDRAPEGEIDCVVTDAC